jgi:hypothetical protein
MNTTLKLNSIINQNLPETIINLRTPTVYWSTYLSKTQIKCVLVPALQRKTVIPVKNRLSRVLALRIL